MRRRSATRSSTWPHRFTERLKYDLASDDVREQRRYRRLRGVAVAGLAVLTVVAVAAGLAFAKQREAVHQRQLADQQREEAIHQRNEAEVRRLLGDADAVLAGNWSGGDFRAFQELLAAHALSPDIAAGGLLDAAIRRITTKKIISIPGEQLSAVAISPKGDRIVSGAYEGAARLLDAQSGRTLATVSENAPTTTSTRMWPAWWSAPTAAGLPRADMTARFGCGTVKLTT